jgi:hypothetical protein
MNRETGHPPRTEQALPTVGMRPPWRNEDARPADVGVAFAARFAAGNAPVYPMGAVQGYDRQGPLVDDMASWLPKNFWRRSACVIA